MTIGQRVDFSTDGMARAVVLSVRLRMGTVLENGTLHPHKVQMLLTSTYLVKVAGNSNVATPPAYQQK